MHIFFGGIWAMGFNTRCFPSGDVNNVKCDLSNCPMISGGAIKVSRDSMYFSRTSSGTF